MYRTRRSTAERDRPVLDWDRTTILWRPEGLELRIPLNLGEGALARFAADEVWGKEPLASMRHEIWSGWLALASPTLLEDIDPTMLRRMLDAAAKRAGDVRGREQGRVEDFLRRLRDDPAASPRPPELRRARARLDRAGIRTIDEALALSDKELLAIDGIGPATVRSIREAGERKRHREKP